MTDLREAAQMALDALDEAQSYTSCATWSPSMTEECAAAAEAIRAALAQPEQEPVACIVKGCSNHRHKGKFVGDLCSPCATFITTGEGKYSQAYRNSQREWQGLTLEEREELRDQYEGSGSGFISAIEAKLKEKNYD